MYCFLNSIFSFFFAFIFISISMSACLLSSISSHAQISSSDQMASGMTCVCMVGWWAVPETALNGPHVTVTICTGITDLECNGTNRT